MQRLPGQRQFEDIQQFEERKKKEHQDNVACAKGAVFIGVGIFQIIYLIFGLAVKSIRGVCFGLKCFTSFIDITLTARGTSKAKRALATSSIYFFFACGMLYSVYAINFGGIAGLERLTRVLNNDKTFIYQSNKSTYKYTNFDHDRFGNVRLIGISGPDTNKEISISKSIAAYKMLNSDNKSPTQADPELVNLISPKTPSAAKNIYGQQKNRR